MSSALLSPLLALSKFHIPDILVQYHYRAFMSSSESSTSCKQQKWVRQLGPYGTEVSQGRATLTVTSRRLRPRHWCPTVSPLQVRETGRGVWEEVQQPSPVQPADVWQEEHLSHQEEEDWRGAAQRRQGWAHPPVGGLRLLRACWSEHSLFTRVTLRSFNILHPVFVLFFCNLRFILISEKEFIPQDR